MMTSRKNTGRPLPNRKMKYGMRKAPAGEQRAKVRPDCHGDRGWRHSLQVLSANRIRKMSRG
jgi:hypothetical protein